MSTILLILAAIVYCVATGVAIHSLEPKIGAKGTFALGVLVAVVGALGVVQIVG